MAGTKAGAAKRKQLLQATPVKGCHVQKEVYFDKALEAGHPVYVVAPKRALKFGDKMLQAGEVVPGAHQWLRLESWLNAGRIVAKTD